MDSSHVVFISHRGSYVGYPLRSFEACWDEPAMFDEMDSDLPHFADINAWYTPDLSYTEIMDAFKSKRKSSVQIVKEGAGARKPDTDCNYFGNAERDHVMNSSRSSASSRRWSALLKKVSQLLKVIRALRVGHHGGLPPLHGRLFSNYEQHRYMVVKLIDFGTAKSLPNEIGSKIECRKRYLRKKIPSRSWSGEETDAVLHLMTEAVVEGPGIWDFVSGNLFERYDFDRASDSCKQQWHTLLQNYRDIRDHESKTPRKSFWDMNEDERSKKKLPRTFNFEWCEMIEKMGSAVDDIECELDEGLSDVSAAARTDDHSYVSQCGEVVESSAGRKRSFDDEDHDLLMKNITTLVNQRVEDALKPRPKIQKLDNESLAGVHKIPTLCRCDDEDSLANCRETLECRLRC